MPKYIENWGFPLLGYAWVTVVKTRNPLSHNGLRVGVTVGYGHP